MSYKVCKLVKLPSSRGTMPENWFASRLLFEKNTLTHKKKKQKKQKQKQKRNIEITKRA
jgi:hypothetical protein